MNAFLDLADTQIASPVKARHRAAEKRAEAHAARAEDESRLLKGWRQWRQEQVDQALAGPHGNQIAALLANLKSITRWVDVDPVAIISGWHSADPDACFIARRLVSNRIIELREAAGLPPFDDLLPL